MRTNSVERRDAKKNVNKLINFQFNSLGDDKKINTKKKNEKNK